MFFEKFIDTDLGHVSYIIGCSLTREAFIIDPRRDIKEYVEFIDKNALNLKYVFNTHTHADYIGGHIELASKYNISNIFQNSAPIINFDILKVKENDEFSIGNTINIKILETPGHTPFDISLLVNENSIDKMLFTGDFLFIGDIGRPDLLGEENLESLVNSSYESAKKLWNLSDDIIIMTSHIEGSLCGKSLSRQFFSTVGIEKRTNCSFKLCQESKNKYVKNLTSQNIETPMFFKKMAGLNISGPKLINKVIRDIRNNVNYSDIKCLENIQIIDLREPEYFHKSHIEGSINICEKSNVSLIAGSFLDYDKDIYLIGGVKASNDDFIIKLLRVGLDNIKGILNNDFSLINNKFLVSSNIISLSKVDKSYTNFLLDKDCSSIGKIVQTNLSKLNEIDLSKYKKIVFSCNHGYKSSAVISILNNKNIFWSKA